MNILAKVTPAPKPRTINTLQVSVFYSGVLTVFLVAQLFTFEAFNKLIPSLNLPFIQAWPYILPSLIIVSELFALPFLLRMQLSVAFRWLSMGFCLLVPFIWFLISLWVVTTQPEVESIGLLGAVVNTVPGWWAVMVSIALGILAIWSSWGLWPGNRSDTIT